jgi:hypothetical protein
MTSSNQLAQRLRDMEDQGATEGEWGPILLEAADEIERLRAALANIADSIDRGYCCHVETDPPHDLRACLRHISRHAKELLAGAADETDEPRYRYCGSFGCKGNHDTHNDGKLVEPWPPVKTGSGL